MKTNEQNNDKQRTTMKIIENQRKSMNTSRKNQ